MGRSADGIGFVPPESTAAVRVIRKIPMKTGRRTTLARTVVGLSHLGPLGPHPDAPGRSIHATSAARLCSNAERGHSRVTPLPAAARLIGLEQGIRLELGARTDDARLNDKSARSPFASHRRRPCRFPHSFVFKTTEWPGSKNGPAAIAARRSPCRLGARFRTQMPVALTPLAAALGRSHNDAGSRQGGDRV